MGDTLYNIAYILLQILYSLIFILFVNSVQTPKVKPWIVILTAVSCWSILFFAYMYTGLKEPFSLLVWVSLVLISLFFYKDRLISKIANIIIIAALAFVMDILAYVTLKSGFDLSSEFFSIISVIVSGMLLSAVAFVASSFLKNRKNIKSKTASIVFILIPLCQITMMYFINVVIMYYDSPKEYSLLNFRPQSHSTSIIIIAITIVCLIIDVIAFRQYLKSVDAAKLEADIEALEYKNELNYSYFKSLKENEMELREIKHDLGGALEIVKELIYKEGDTEKAKVLFDELSETVKNIHTGFYCKNSLVNAILLNKAKTCKEKEIEFRTEITLSDNISIEDADLCRALVNMLDNAIEAAEQIEDDKKFVKIDIKTKDGYLFIKTENPYSKEFDISETSKENKKDHGYGLQILSGFAEKYNGNFSVTNENDSVVSLLSMQNV